VQHRDEGRLGIVGQRLAQRDGAVGGQLDPVLLGERALGLLRRRL
jgi:hypothetical protein